MTERRAARWFRLPAAVLLALLVFAPAGAITEGIRSRIPEAWPVKEWLTTAIFQLLMLALAFGYMLWIGRGRLARFGFTRGSHFPGWAVVKWVFLAEAFVTVAFLPFAKEGPGHFAGDFNWWQVLIGVFLIASTAEEVVTRGLVQGYLEPLKESGIRMGSLFFSAPNVTAALLFSAMHIPLLIMGIDTVLGIEILVSTFLLGLIAGHYREHTGSLLPAIFAHMLANAFGSGLGRLTEWIR
jgi:membrane protease YdiL (CAAX protease family)